MKATLDGVILESKYVEREPEGTEGLLAERQESKDERDIGRDW